MGIEYVEVRQVGCRDDRVDGSLVVGDVLQALPHPPGVSRRREVVQPLSVLHIFCCRND